MADAPDQTPAERIELIRLNLDAPVQDGPLLGHLAAAADLFATEALDPADIAAFVEVVRLVRARAETIVRALSQAEIAAAAFLPED